MGMPRRTSSATWSGSCPRKTGWTWWRPGTRTSSSTSGTATSRAWLGAVVTAVLLAGSFGSALVRAAGTPLPPSGNRAPAQVVFSPDGGLAYVSEAEEGTVAILDARQFTVLGRVETGGRKPAGLALTRDGATLLAANTFSGSIGVIETRSRK